MTWISLLQPSDLAEWESGYHANVKTPAELDEVAGRAWAEFQHYLQVSQSLTEADFKSYLRELALKRTFEGWSQRRDEVLEYLKGKTGIPFDYLRDTPMDWRPRTYDIDFAAEHPASGYWLAVKALPTSTPTAPYPGVNARLTEMHNKHQQFQDKLGLAVSVTFSMKERVKKYISDEHVALIEDTWAKVAALK